MNFRTLLPAAALLALSFTACSDNDVDDPAPLAEVETGAPAGFTLKINQPATTRAADPNATQAETVFNTADVFIYADNRLVKHVTLDKDDFTPQGNHTYASNEPIITTAGPKVFYIGLNMPAAMAAKVASSRAAAGIFEVFNVDDYNVADLTKGFIMFSDKAEPKNLIEGTDALTASTNAISVEVSRISAKVSTTKDENLKLDVEGGKFDNFQFAIRNSNKLYFPFQNDQGSFVLDPNYYTADYNPADFKHFTDYANVDAYNVEPVDRQVRYTPENTTQSMIRKESTYASLKATFVPDEFTDATGKATDNKGNSPRDFYTVKIKEDGRIYYFDNLSDATAFAAIDNQGVVSELYKGGVCYYSLFLNPRGGYQTYRNEFYNLNIVRINGLGSANPDDDDEDDNKIEEPAALDVVIDILEWNYWTDDYELF